jgi:uncharacterized membrane protein
MSEIIETIDLEVPVEAAYDQWTQFEDFPGFMDGIDAVYQMDDRTLDWHAVVAGIPRNWRARITEQVPDRRIAWTSIEGTGNAGVVTFHRLDRDHSRVTLQLAVEPHGVLEDAGDALGLVQRRTRGDLRRFKDFIEGRRTPTGAWRGEVQPDGQEAPARGG